MRGGSLKKKVQTNNKRNYPWSLFLPAVVADDQRRAVGGRRASSSDNNKVVQVERQCYTLFSINQTFEKTGWWCFQLQHLRPAPHHAVPRNERLLDVVAESLPIFKAKTLKGLRHIMPRFRQLTSKQARHGFNTCVYFHRLTSRARSVVTSSS